MKFVAKSAIFVVASAFVAVEPALAGAGGAGVPFPVAGLGLLGLGALAYGGRILRRRR